MLDNSLIKGSENQVLDFLFFWRRPIRVGDLKTHLIIKHSTLNSVLKRLESQNFVKWEKYGPVELTNEGMEHAAHLSNHHFIIEKFFKQILSLPEEDAHNEAIHLAGAFSCQIIGAMCEKLGITEDNIHNEFCDSRDYQDFK